MIELSEIKLAAFGKLVKELNEIELFREYLKMEQLVSASLKDELYSSVNVSSKTFAQEIAHNSGKVQALQDLADFRQYCYNMHIEQIKKEDDDDRRKQKK